MRILLAKTIEPFLSTESDRIACDLIQAIQSAGHFCEGLRIPLIEAIALSGFIRALELENTDLLVCLDQPCHNLRHPAKVLVQWDDAAWKTGTIQGTIHYVGVVPTQSHPPDKTPTSWESGTRRFGNRDELLQCILV